ncbi:uncharacterized protein MELLADRAFT_113818 [Melampsora larici-populina 98AG31]|uniref:Uncharacterized protein n=1 Tax=Melampsora larici-populina (strain 98AG31 / pathotype 3-4-7) TaxID=747676 RepID=F4SB55_MELLP|nr:uncharacterized protein MELLADRAFT_113818 [Melampsora larici-populina 98AG31]EGF98135.1 hypothetical protein MELLADRAFT_113818 [Melampsora larici-populina 98AG31]
MIAVIRFNERQYIEYDGKHVQTEASLRLFKQFDQSMSTMYQHGTAQNKFRTNGPTIRVSKNRRGDMFAIGIQPGYLKGVAGACDGVVEMVWATNVRHQTTESTAHYSTGQCINPKDAVIT